MCAVESRAVKSYSLRPILRSLFCALIRLIIAIEGGIEMRGEFLIGKTTNGMVGLSE
jgi:hypothetical protein